MFRDADGTLGRAREALAWYPQDVWLWLLACQWRRIDQEEPFVGRTAEVGDEVGSRVLCARAGTRCHAARLPPRAPVRAVCEVARLGVPPPPRAGGARAAHSKPRSQPTTYEERETALVGAMETLARLHNRVQVTAPVDETSRTFHDRPFRVLGSGRFAAACLDKVADERLRALPLVGGIDQLADSTDVLAYPRTFEKLASTYRAWLDDPEARSR